MNELKEISVELQGLEKTPDFTVPEGYFDRLAGEILDRIKQDPITEELREVSPLLSRISRHNPYQVPEGYFADLDLQVQDMTGLNPATEAWPKSLPYQLPENYFDQLPGQIMDKVKSTQGALVVTIKRRSSLYSYAAAAITVGFIVLAATLYLNNGNSQSSGTENKHSTLQLASLPDQAMMEYLQLHTDVTSNDALYSSLKNESLVPSLVSGLSNADLRAYLDNTVNLDENVAN